MKRQNKIPHDIPSPQQLLVGSLSWPNPDFATGHVTYACAPNLLSIMTGQLVTKAAAKPTQQLTDVFRTTALLQFEASTHALKNK